LGEFGETSARNGGGNPEPSYPNVEIKCRIEGAETIW